MSLTFSEGEGARRADEGLLITLISLAALASAKLPARLQKSFTFSGERCPRGKSSNLLRGRRCPQGGSSNLLRGEGARRADEGLLITLISLAALASFPQEKLKTMLPAGRKNVSHLLQGEGARRADLLTFSEEKVPAGRMRVS